METDDLKLLKNNAHTRDLSSESLEKCPLHLLENLIQYVKEHSRRLTNNCGEAYRGMQQIREEISRSATAIREILKNN